MAGKPKLHYFNGRGRMESVRWLLASAGVEFEEEFIETREQYDKLLQVLNGFLRLNMKSRVKAAIFSPQPKDKSSFFNLPEMRVERIRTQSLANNQGDVELS